MTAYLITYDLCKPETSKDYEKLIDKIEKFHNHCKITESCWLINSPQKALDIANELEKFVDSNDRLVVAELLGNIAWTKILCTKEELNKVLHG